MIAETELQKWLTRPNKTFSENLNFAIKAWKSSELTLSNKYPIIIKWFTTEIENFSKSKKPVEIDFDRIEEFLKLKCATGLLKEMVLYKIPDAFIDLAISGAVDLTNRRIIEILLIICEHESLQKYHRSKSDKYCQMLDVLFSRYDLYLKHLDIFRPEYEREFFTRLINYVKDFVKAVSDSKALGQDFATYCLMPLIRVIIILKDKNLKFFGDLLDIEKTLFIEDEFRLLTLHKCSIIVILQNLECAICNFQSFSPFTQKILQEIFENYPEIDRFKSNPKILLTISSHVLDLFKKYDVHLNFEYATNMTAVKYLSEKIQNYVNLYHQDHLLEVLTLLCSVIKLNPLILEHNIFNITTKCLVARKTNDDWLKYEEFLSLLMEMFKKLSRGEKLVLYLLKSVNEHLKNHKLSKNLKRKLNNDGNFHENLSEKRIKTEDNKSVSIISTMKTLEITEQDYYLSILRNEFNQSKPPPPLKSTIIKDKTWSNISYAWPSHTVGVAFSRFISNLMSKPSLVIWKTLIFSFSECIDNLESTSNNPDENLLFLIDFNASLLCQYFLGCRLSEQSDKFWNDIINNKNLTNNILKRYGQTLLKFEHNNRTMNAFLELSYNYGYFELINWYYCPDSLTKDVTEQLKTKTIHNYLTQNEWTLIEQRIVNFGKNECKIAINKLGIQKIKAQLLFKKPTNTVINIENCLLSSALTDIEQVKAIFCNPNNLWLTNYLTKEQKLQICDHLLLDDNCKNVEYIKNFTNLPDFLEIILLNLYKFIASDFNTKKSILSAVDFNGLLMSSDNERIKNVVNLLKEKKESYSIKKYSPDDVKRYLNIITSMPVGFCNLSTKTLVFALQLALYRDLLAAKNDELASICLNFFPDILRFEPPIDIFKYFDIDMLMIIFPPTKSPQFYELIFSGIKRTIKNTEKCLTRIVALLKADNNSLTDDNLKLCIILIESLSNQSIKQCKSHLKDILSLYGEHVKKYFNSGGKHKPEEDKEFVKKSLPAFTTYLHSVLSKLSKDDDIDEDFRKICKIYIGYSIDCQDSHSIKLINAALQHREILHFDPDEIQFVLKKYWDELQEDLINNKENIDNAEAIIKLVVYSRTPEEFAQILSEIEDSQKANIDYMSKVYCQISKCHLSNAKGLILNNHFKETIFNIILKLERNDNYQFKNITNVLKLLDCQKAICENGKILLSVDLIDDILSFLMDINIKKFVIDDTNRKVFNDLHLSMTAVSSALIKSRHFIITDRIPQFVYIFRDLLQAVCWYKCDRQRDAKLDDEELDDLAELAHRLENLMRYLAAHSLDVKRVAPYLLTFTISLMVTNKRPTTLYPKIKTHIEGICYDLISVCDHRVGSFILRCSNEAMKQVYETLCKDYQKYHKFKGKV